MRGVSFKLSSALLPCQDSKHELTLPTWLSCLIRAAESCFSPGTAVCQWAMSQSPFYLFPYGNFPRQG
jgi:hypothetical protein